MRRSKKKARKTRSGGVGRVAGSAALSGITPAEVLEPLLWLLDTVGVPRRAVLAMVRTLPPVKLPARVIVMRGELEYWSRTLMRWAADPGFLGADGRPRDLSFVAGVPSFSDLVALELPGESAAICRDTLLATSAITRLPNGLLRWRGRAAIAKSAKSGVILADEYLRPLRALLLVLQSNLLRRARRVPPGGFLRAVSGFELSAEDMAQLHSFVSRHGTALLETVDDWLAQRQQERKPSGRASLTLVRPYLGLYLSTDSYNTRAAGAGSPRQPHQKGAPRRVRKPIKRSSTNRMRSATARLIIS